MDTNRFARITGLPPGQFVFSQMWAAESLGRAFCYDIELLSEDANVDPLSVLGHPAGVTVDLPLGGERFFHGYVERFDIAGTSGRFSRYLATLRPSLWLLNRTRNSRIFQGMSVPDVIKTLLREWGLSDFEDQSGSYRTWEYLVQYRESDFDFISRLMEQEGLYYYYKHTFDKHGLVIADSYSAHAPIEGCETVPYYPRGDNARRERDHIDSWQVSNLVVPGAVSLRDFNFETPRANLQADLRMPAKHPLSEFEVYDYPGEYGVFQDGETQMRVRLEELQSHGDTIMAGGDVRGLYPGGLFRLTRFPREDQNREYLVVSVHHEISVGSHETAGKDPGKYRCTFKAIKSDRPYRTPATTRKPKVEGPQTAIVVGKDGEDIWTDQYGRIKVQFHWDRNGVYDERSSCWVRVAQVWAGSGWGAMHIPRIGQEVIVDFLEGNPNRPIVIGCVYNADNMPPYELPSNATQSGIKSRSTKNGNPDNFNEIRFEDMKGSEELHVQAEKDHSTLVKHDKTTTVQNNRSASIGANDSTSVAGDQSLSVTGNRSVTIDGQGNSPVHSTVSVTGKHSLHASDTIEVDAPTHIKLECGGSSILIEPGKITLTAGGKAVIVLDANVYAAANGKANILLDANVKAASSAGSQVLLDGNALTASSGKASVLLDGNVTAQSSGNTQMVLDGNATVTSNGDITMDGMNIAAKGKTQAEMSVGGSSCKVSPAGVEAAGPTVNVNGSGMVSIAGPMIKIG